MYPIICQVGDFAIYSYGVMMALAVILCSILLSRDATKIGIKSEVIFDFVFWLVLGGIVGARLFFIILNLEYFSVQPLEVLNVRSGGLAWQGGLVFGTIAGLAFIRAKKLPLFITLDLAAPYIALGQAIGRLGCFLNGCCHGKESDWGLFFPIHNAALIPTQLFSAAGLFVIFLVLKKYQTLTHKEGQVFFLYLMLASLKRFIIQFFRDDQTIVVLGLTIFQVICVVVFFIGLFLFLRKRK